MGTYDRGWADLTAGVYSTEEKNMAGLNQTGYTNEKLMTARERPPNGLSGTLAELNQQANELYAYIEEITVQFETVLRPADSPNKVGTGAGVHASVNSEAQKAVENATTI